MKKTGSIKTSNVMSESKFFNSDEVIKTDLPILNMAFSGDIDGGLVPGLTIFAGESKSFKSMLALYCIKSYLEKYSEAVCLFYDSEFGITPKMLESFKIDCERMIHIPVEHVEQLKFDIVKRLESIERGEKVLILVDSLGNLASKKEVEDAIDEKSVADMSRAKAIRSLFRIITPHLTTKELPCIVVNHVYQTMEMFSKIVIPGGTAVTYSANQIFVITKSQIKEGKDLVGYNFTINIQKSRFVKEKSKFPFSVTYENGISKWSSLLELAIESGYIKQSGAWYQIYDFETNELQENKIRQKNIPNKFFKALINDSKFKEFIISKYKLGQIQMDFFDEEEEEIQEENESTDQSNLTNVDKPGDLSGPLVPPFNGD
jgi:RecA/RadA recombinase